MMNRILLFLLVSSIFSYKIHDNTLLFCLNQNEPLLSLDSNGLLNRESHNKINEFLSSISNSYFIEPWLSAATENDYSGDIYLNRIYRIVFNNLNRASLSSLKNELSSLSSIVYVEYEYLRKPYYTPNDIRYNQQWFLTQVQADHAWDFWDFINLEPGSKDVLLASVDTGVDWNHTDLVNSIWQNLGEDADGDGKTLEYIDGEWVFDPDDLNGVDDDNWDQNPNTFIDDLIGWDPSGISGENDNNPSPKPGVGTGSTWAHGTHVAGLLAATTDNTLGIASVAFNSSIMSVKVSRENQEGDPYITDGYDGILYAAKAGYYGSDRGFAIINNSWGGGGFSQFENATIEVSHDTYNAIIVAAAGNGSETGWEEEESIHYPSSYNHVISVTALGTSDRWNHWATYHETVDLGSPGENIMSTKIQNGTETYAYTSWDGTSMASPIAASCIGLLSSFNTDWGNEQLETMIVATADPSHYYTVNTEGYLQGKLGSGRVDAYRALLTPLFPKIEIAAIDYQIIGGNFDNIIDAGESLNLSTILLNDFEWGEAINPSITLNSLSNYITVVNPDQSIANIPAGDVYLNDSNPFEVLISENTPIGDYELELLFSSNETSYTGSSFNAIYEVKDTVSISVNNALFSDTFIPDQFEILNPYPNPFNPSTTLSWKMNQSGHFKIQIYDLNGTQIGILVDSYHTPGFYQYKWSPINFSNGIYFIRYSLEDKNFIQKLTLLK